MADPLSGIAIIICIAFGVLTILLLSIFANRQIKRFSLNSKRGPHMPIAQDAPKVLQTEINRRFDVIKNISYQPHLLNESDESLFDENIESPKPSHLYRMKALDSTHLLDTAILGADTSCKISFNQDYRVFLIRRYQSGLFGKLEISVINRYADLYELARHEPGDFQKEQYLQFMDYMSHIQQSICPRSSRQQCSSRTTSPARTLEPNRSSTNGNIPATPLSVPGEATSEDKKSTFETSV